MCAHAKSSILLKNTFKTFYWYDAVIKPKFIASACDKMAVSTLMVIFIINYFLANIHETQKCRKLCVLYLIFHDVVRNKQMVAGMMAVPVGYIIEIFV